MEPRDDRALLDAVADGDREALRELYEHHTPWLLMRLSRRCGDPGLVEEAVQDTFLAVWRRPDSYRGRGDVAAWIWGIAIRRLIDLLRRQEVRERITVPEAVDLGRPVEDAALSGLEHGDFAGALAQLSPELRAVLEATVLDGLTTREASTLLGIPVGTVKTRAMRARAQLREALS